MRAVVGWCRPPSRDLRAGHGSTTCPFGVLGGRHRRIDIPPLPRASTAGGARGRNKDPAAGNNFLRIFTCYLMFT